jgi:hypothetical protein
MTVTFSREFPDYPTAAMPVFPAGFVDSSWHNDACPSITSAALGLLIFIDYPEVNDRELHGPRVSVQTLGDAPAEVFAAEQWADVLAYLAKVHGGSLT